MMIQLPEDLEGLVQAAVHGGRFASVDDALAEAVRLLLRDIAGKESSSEPTNHGLGSIGAMHDDADLLDQAVAHAMKAREERPWRSSDLE